MGKKKTNKRKDKSHKQHQVHQGHRSETKSTTPTTTTTTLEAQTLTPEEQLFLSKVSIDCGHEHHSNSDTIVTQATTILEHYHMVILHNVLTPEDIQSIYGEYEDLLDLTGDSAIGEKDASKRSGTRFYNCRCQVGPACTFHGWKGGSEQTKEILHGHKARHVHHKPRQHRKHNKSSGAGVGYGGRPQQLQTWERITRHFGFEHIARVEVVTSHPGCRNQGWHTDGTHGLTVIFPLVNVDLRKGPTQMDFNTPFNNLHENSGKVGGKKKRMDAPDFARAAMPKGSVVMFNANMSHRGTANLSKTGRPILVLDCSLRCVHEAVSLWDVEHPPRKEDGEGAERCEEEKA
jgi:hypothetical protein